MLRPMSIHAVACILALTAIAYPVAAFAADVSPPPATGAGNYLIPVPPDLPQRLTEANKREEAVRAAEETKAKNEGEHARDATTEQTAPPKGRVDPLGGIMYH